MNGRSHAIIGAAAGLTLVITQAVTMGTAIQPLGWDGMAVAIATAAALSICSPACSASVPAAWWSRPPSCSF